MDVVVSVGVSIENEVFARGVEACLREARDTRLCDLTEPDGGPDLVVVSYKRMGQNWGCPVLVCTDEPLLPSEIPEQVVGLVPLRTLTPAQLVPAVRAAAAGFRLASPHHPGSDIGRRGIDVLRLLADGAGTREISHELGYSERTIKGVISDLERNLGARSRAHVVALALRQSLI